MRAFFDIIKRRRILRWLICVAVALVIVPLLTLAVLWLMFPFDREPLAEIPTSTRWCDRDGIPLRIRLTDTGEDSLPIYEYQAEDWIGKAVVAAEDQRFWSHHGVDPFAVMRSCRQNVFSMRRVSGASTLSMQLVRMTWPRERTLSSKSIEAFRALQMEACMDKEEILSLYLNRAPFGANLVGIESASQRYFSKGAQDLSLGEASLLAGIPQSPTRFNPVRFPEAAKKRQSYVLERMLACGFITAEQREIAMAQPLRFREERYPFKAPHFCDLVTRQPIGGDGQGGGDFRTTLDMSLQTMLEDALSKVRPELHDQRIDGMAAVILDAKTSEVLAMVGSPDFHAKTQGAQVNAAMAPRSAGSTLKPFAYAIAMDRGFITPRRVLYDVPQTYRDYDPENFDRGYRGVVTVRDALIHSLNLPVLDVEKQIGQPLLHSRLRELGLSSISEPAEHYGLGLVLGNAEVRLLDLANSYACLARGGEYLPYRTMQSEARVPAVRMFPEEVCWMISDIMGGDERAMIASGTVADIRIPKLAWKTGTSSGFRDAWTIAYNPEYVIGVWLGNPDGRSSSHLIGSKAAAPIVWDLCRRLYPSGVGPWFQKPSGIEEREVCAVSGQTPSRHCKDHILDDALPGVSLHETCQVHYSGPEEVWPVRVDAFLKSRQRDEEGETKHDLVITSPADRSVYRYLAEQHQQDYQRIAFSANSSDASTEIHWFVNDRHVGVTKPGKALFWPVARGEFRVVCSDTQGLSRTVRISVK